MRVLRVNYGGSAQFARTTASDVTQLELLDAAPWHGGRPTGVRVAASDVKPLAPLVPTKIVCVGRNYAAHAAELGNAVPAEPLLFLKPPSALLAPEAAIVLPAQSERVEHEAEVGIVIGMRLHNATEETAVRAIYGVTCVNDVTARDIQRKEVQFTRAKSFDTFCPVGPCIETVFDLDKLEVIGRVNGEVRQQAKVTAMVTSIPKLVAFISQVMTLEAGDLIATGTPEGVGPLVAGDRVEVEIPGVGVLRNCVVGSS